MDGSDSLGHDVEMGREFRDLLVYLAMREAERMERMVYSMSNLWTLKSAKY